MLLDSGRRLLVLIAALAGLTVATGASAASISFSGIGDNRSALSQDFGDGGGLDLSYATIGGSGGSLGVWNRGYYGAAGAIYATCSSCVGEITLAPDPGQTMTIDAIGVAAWQVGRRSNITIYNADYSEVLYYEAFGLGTARNRPVGISASDTVHIQWGADAYLVGVTSLDVSMAASAQSVPEPGLALLVLAPAALLAARRLRA